jgi:hypothetical protein
MMVQQQQAHAQMAAAQAQAAAHAQAAQMAAVQQLQQQIIPPAVPAIPKQHEPITDDKLQEKGI